MIITIIGARPQFIKAAVVSKALKKEGIKELIIHTGQHYDYEMSQIFWNQLNLPDNVVNLKIGGGTHGSQTGKMLQEIENTILTREIQPKVILLYGDTNSTLAGAIVASKLHIPIVHIEAGLRSYNKKMPEEINRILTDRISDTLFCSSKIGVENLDLEGITNNVYISGDVMKDAVFTFREFNSKNVYVQDLEKGSFNLLTIHRPSNTDNINKLKRILEILGQADKIFVWPLHPRLAKTIDKLHIPSNVKITTPLGYIDMLSALAKSEKVITDSGGLQKEAYWLKKPTITIRNETEWLETLENGCNTLVKDDLENLLESINNPKMPIWNENLYGNGQAAIKIAKIIHGKYS